MWVTLVVIALFYVAYTSGEHHGERAKRIIERNRPERHKKWKNLERKLRLAKEEIKRLKNAIRSD
jgi:adenosyl cobinamide kinase/adenosyl cobinamide phosphate guanylyltransferase